MKTTQINKVKFDFNLVSNGPADHASFQSVDEILCVNGLVHCSLGVIQHTCDLKKIPIPQDRYVATVLEIGTYRGCSIAQFDRMIPQAYLNTLNILPEQAPPGTPELLTADEIGKFARERGVLFNQHYGDSKTFPFVSTFGPSTADVVFVDGRHTYDYVLSDSENAKKVISPGGVIIWHDYHKHNEQGMDVTRALDELNDTMFDGRLVHVEDTSLVYWIAGAK